MTKTLTVQRNHIEPGQPGNNQTYRICGAKTRQETSAPMCQRPSGWGTSHTGEGRCKLHGGANLVGPDQPAWRGGRYAHVFKGELAKHFEAIQADDTDPLDLLPELEVQRVLLARYLDRLGGSQRDHHLTRAQREAGIVDSPVTSPDVSDGDVSMVVDGGVGHLSVVGSSVSHPRAQFFPLTAEELDQLRLLTGDIVGTVTKIITARNQTAITKAEIVWMMSTLKEGIEMFVPREKQGAFVKWLQARIPIGGKGKEADDE